MLIFLDSEFTDFIDCELISIGMISEDGQQEFYAEISDYDPAKASRFVQEAILPLLGTDPAAICTKAELRVRLWSWFATLPRQVQIACDSHHDRDLLWDALYEGLPANLDREVMNLRSLIDTTVFNDEVVLYHGHTARPWHHALHDARAHREGWMAWMGC
jgi:hypothetical protein